MTSLQHASHAQRLLIRSNVVCAKRKREPGSASTALNACADRLVQHGSLSAGLVSTVLKELEEHGCLREEAPKNDTLRKRAWRSRVKTLGAIAIAADLEMSDGKTEKWIVADPIRQWEERAARDSNFLQLLEMVLERGPIVHVLLYLDEATAGDPLHPDPARKAWMCYTSFVAAEMNMLHDRAWQTVAVLRNARARLAAGGLSGMCKTLLKSWLAAGVFEGRATQLGGRKIVVRLKVHALCADEQAHAAMWSVSGAAGRRPCWRCSNCISNLAEQQIRDTPHASSFCGLSEGRIRNFQPTPDNTVYQALDALSAAAASGPKYKLKDLEKNTGFKHEPTGLLYCHELRNVVRPSQTVFDVLSLGSPYSMLLILGFF